jgi:2'-5' RNA ligase
MLRYFVAIPFSDEIKSRLHDLQPSSVPGVRSVQLDSIHLTLHFLGELPDSSRDAVCNVLSTLTIEAFELTIRGVGVFPPKGAPTVLWVGVEHNPALASLHSAIGVALTNSIGFEVEKRPYSPHITIGRMRDEVDHRGLDDFLNQHQTFEISSIPVTKFVLFSSDLSGRIPIYRELVEFILNPAIDENSLRK